MQVSHSVEDAMNSLLKIGALIVRATGGRMAESDIDRDNGVPVDALALADAYGLAAGRTRAVMPKKAPKGAELTVLHADIKAALRKHLADCAKLRAVDDTAPEYDATCSNARKSLRFLADSLRKRAGIAPKVEKITKSKSAKPKTVKAQKKSKSKKGGKKAK